MTTAAVQASSVADLALRRRFDHWFFSGMACLIFATVFIGFARTYYIAGVFRAPLPSSIIHFHGAAFSLWILLLVTQTSLISARRVNFHRRLGMVGFLLACAMAMLGFLAATNALVRGSAPPGMDPATFYVVPLTDMVIFSTLIFFAFRNRFDAPTHKRLILIATIALLTAAIVRWPFAPVYLKPLPATLVSYVFLLMLAGYDWWSMRRIHRATIWGGTFMIFAQQLRIPLGQTPAWHAFAAWMEKLGRVYG